MKASIKIFNNVTDLAKFVAEHLMDRINRTPRGHYFSIALSGGSTPRSVFQYLAKNFKNKINWEKLLIFWGDERCVFPENDESNFKMAYESLLKKVPIPETNVFRIFGENNPLEEANRYAQLMRRHVPSKNLIPQFDFIMLGLGSDGHTASVFPGNQELFESDHLCEVAKHPETLQKRITITGKVINQASTVAFLVIGSAKAQMVGTVLKQGRGWEKFPASWVQPETGNLLWLIDSKAAANLDLNYEIK